MVQDFYFPIKPSFFFNKIYRATVVSIDKLKRSDTQTALNYRMKKQQKME